VGHGVVHLRDAHGRDIGRIVWFCREFCSTDYEEH